MGVHGNWCLSRSVDNYGLRWIICAILTASIKACGVILTFSVAIRTLNAIQKNYFCVKSKLIDELN